MIEKDPPISTADMPKDGMGRAYLRLNERQRKFVLAVLALGVNTDHSKAARMAGYTGNANVIGVTAHRLFHDPVVQEAIHDMAIAKMTGSKMAMVANLEWLAVNAAKEEVRAKCTLEWMNRVGLHAVTEHHVKTQDVSTTKEAMLHELKMLVDKNPDAMKLLPPAAQKLLAKSMQPIPAPEPVVEDAEFVEVDPDADILGD